VCVWAKSHAMVLTEEDRAWFEQRLELHHRAVEVQLQTHYAKLCGAIFCSRQAGGGNLLGLSKANDVDDDLEILEEKSMGMQFSLSKSSVRSEGPEADTPQSMKAKPSKGAGVSSSVSTKMISTALHHLTVDDEKQLVDPKSCRGRLISFLDSYGSTFINLCVLGNTLTMFVQLQYLGNVANVSLGLSPTGSWTHADTILQGFEYAFTIIFCLDLLFQLFAFRRRYFASSFNIMDSVIVVITSLEVFVFTPLAASIGNVAVVRLLRLAKLARAFKAARTFKSFEGLRVLVATMCFSFGSTFWSLVILFVFQIMGSIFMCQSLHDFVVDSEQDHLTRSWVNDMYGDGFKSFWTIFELTFSGCWPNYARRIIDEVNPIYAVFYFLYVYIVVFVATRIVAALFMKETLSQYANDAEMMVKERSRKSAWIKQTLYNLFDEADANRDGTLTREELRSFLSHNKVQLWLKELGCDASDQNAFITLLDDSGGNTVTRDEFVYSITRLRGEARSQDLVQVFNTIRRLTNHVKEIGDSVERIAKDLEPPRLSL